MVSHRSQFFPLFFHSFTRHHFSLHSSLPNVFFTIVPPILLNRPIVYAVYAMPLSIYPSISSIFPVFCHRTTRFLHHYPYVTSVCLTLTQMHLPQSQSLHRITGFARFFHGVLLLHSGPTSEPQFFHCFSIVLLHFFIIVPRFFHCFSIANGLTSKPQFFHCFSIVLLESSIVCTLGKEMLLVTNFGYRTIKL